MRKSILVTLLTLKLIVTPMFAGSVSAAEVADLMKSSTVQTSELKLGLLTLTSSSTIHLEKFNGIGVVGGRSNKSIDQGESLTLSFSQPVFKLKSYQTCLIADANGDGIKFRIRLEAYDHADRLQKRLELSPRNCLIDYSDVLGIKSISRLVITVLSDSITIGGFTFDKADHRHSRRTEA